MTVGELRMGRHVHARVRVATLPVMARERQRVFVCSFDPGTPGAPRTVERVAAPDADHALHHFTVLLSPQAGGWIDVRDERGVLLRTRYWSPSSPSPPGTKPGR